MLRKKAASGKEETFAERVTKRAKLDASVVNGPEMAMLEDMLGALNVE